MAVSAHFLSDGWWHWFLSSHLLPSSFPAFDWLWVCLGCFCGCRWGPEVSWTRASCQPEESRSLNQRQEKLWATPESLSTFRQGSSGACRRSYILSKAPKQAWSEQSKDPMLMSTWPNVPAHDKWDNVRVDHIHYKVRTCRNETVTHNIANNFSLYFHPISGLLTRNINYETFYTRFQILLGSNNSRGIQGTQKSN